MSATTTLNNIFFSFWYVLGEHFIAIISLALLSAIIYYLYYFLVKR